MNIQKVPLIHLLLLTVSLFILNIGCGPIHPQSEPGPYWKMFNKDKRAALDLLIEALSLQKQDLGIRRPLPVEDPFLLKGVPHFFNSPFQIISFSNECSRMFNQGKDSLASTINHSADLLELEIKNPKQEPVPLPAELNQIQPPPVRRALKILYPAMVQAIKIFEGAFDSLDPLEVRFAKKEIESFLFPDSEGAEGWRYEKQGRIEKAFLLASRIDRKKMLEASMVIALALDQALPLLNQMERSQIKGLSKERVTLRTPFGEILIGGSKDDTYKGKMPLILIDLGGNDQYRFEEHSPFNLLIDLSGNDQYHSTEKSYLGAGVQGMGFLIDLRGDDLYEGKNYSFGTGFFGAGFLFDREGNDRYLSRMFSQGAGAIGVGLLCDSDGNDAYQTALFGQGFGFVGGGGFLLDHRGKDTFFAGGLIPDHRERSGAFQTFSQGFGLGARPFASGGLGLLYNGEGDDSYEGSYFSQGAGYWLSIGVLIDREGNDRYRARRYSQGAGTHWAFGALLDHQGNDRYLSWGVSQGCGHDRSIGILWDGQGDDQYRAEWLSQGAGNDSGKGVLIDEKGNDRYEAGTDGTQGSGKFDAMRDEGSIGLLLDGGGEDTFSGQGKERRLWTGGQWGGGMDYEGLLPTLWKESFQKRLIPKAFPSFRAEVKTDDKEWPQLILPELEEPLSSGESWVKSAESLAKQGPSVLPALMKYLEIKDVGVRITLEETIKRLSKERLNEIHLFLKKTPIEKEKQRFLLYVLGEIGNPESKKIFLEFLKEEDRSLQAPALRGLFKLKEILPVEEVIRLSKNKNLDVRRYLCLSLRYGQNPDYITILQGLLKDVDFNVRLAASEALQALGK